MKKLLCLLIVLLCIYNSSAQNTWCLTKAPTQSQKGVFLQQFQALESLRNARKTAETINNVGLKIHLVSKSNGVIEVSDNDIKELVDTLNRHFIKANIQFFVCGKIDYINDDEYYTFDTRQENAFCRIHDFNNAVNVYLVKEFEDPSLGGYSYFPASDKATNRVFCAFKSKSNLITKILPHEMGHYFGLLHTFQDSNYEPLAEVVSRGEKANCTYRGDLLCDTPADPYGEAEYRIENCQFLSVSVDPNGERFTPQLGNLMSYYRGCGNFFTPGQIGMMKTGLFIRMIQDHDRNLAYSIDCQGISSSMIVSQTLYIDGKERLEYPVPEICVERPFTIAFKTQGEFKSDNEYTAYLISNYNTHSVEIGRGKANEIICKIPTNTPEQIAAYRVQIVSSNPALHSTLSAFEIYVNKTPEVEISGSYDLFENEKVTIPVKISGGSATVEFSNQVSAMYNPFPRHTAYFTAHQTEIIRITRVTNDCGEGVGKGQLALNVLAKPVASSFTVENLSGKFLCEGSSINLMIKANGVFRESNAFRIQISDNTGDNFRDIALHTDAGRMPEIKVPENLVQGSTYKIKVISTNPGIEYISENLTAQSVSATLTGNEAIVNGQKANLKIQLKGIAPFTLISSEGDSFISQHNEYQWHVAPTETKVFSLKSVSNETCGNGQAEGSATVKVDYLLKTSTIKHSFVCAGTTIKVPYEWQGGIQLKDLLIVQLSDKTGKNFKTITNGSSTNPLSVIIPDDITEGYNYRIRVISEDGKYIGSESNEFEIRKKPGAFLEGGVAGNKGTAATLPVKLSGGGPWLVEMNTGTQHIKQSIIQGPGKIPITIEASAIYKLSSVSNACGTGKVYGQAVSTLRENAEEYCRPVDNAASDQMGRVARLRITDTEGNMLLNSFEIKMGKDSYTDNTAMMAYLKPGSTYKYDIASSDLGSEYLMGTIFPYYLILWIDYDQNGRFDRDEIIVENALQFSATSFKIPQNAKKGITRMRVRSYYSNSQSLASFPCALSYGGETEDYTIFITDENQPYSAEIKVTERAFCKAKEYEFPLTSSNSFSENNIFRIGLYNSFGNFLGYVGESKTSPIKIKFPPDIPIGANYKLKLFASEPYYESNFTVAFRINDIPSATLSGNQRVYLGQEIPLQVILDGGSDWAYNLGTGAGGTGNYVDNQLIINYPGESSHLTSKPGIYDFRIKQVFNAGCDEGRVSGSARVEVLEPDPSKPTISKIVPNFDSGMSNYIFYRCQNQSPSRSITYETKGTFGKDNYFSCHLISPDDKFVTVIGYAKTNTMFVSIPINIVGYGYKLKIVSSDPYTESPLSNSFVALPSFEAKLSGYSEILPGEQGTIRLDFNGLEPWNVTLSDGTSIVTNLPSQVLKVSPTTTQTYTITQVYSNLCSGAVMGSATVRVLAPRATFVSLKRPDNVCAGSSTIVHLRADGSFRERNSFTLKLLKENGREIRDIEAQMLNDSTLNFIFPKEILPDEAYRLKLISTSPYIESENSPAFTVKPLTTATISRENKIVYEGQKVKLRIDFKGEAPYNFELSDGTRYQNITQNPFFVELNAKPGKNQYTITSLHNSCGQGEASGLIEFNALLLPAITSIFPISGTVCEGAKTRLSFTIGGGVFQLDNTFKVEMTDQTNTDFKEISSTLQGDSLIIVIPENSKAGGHLIRIRGTSPMVVSSAIQVIIKNKTKGEIFGFSTIIAGDSAHYGVKLSRGTLPWSFRLSNGIEYKGIYNEIFYGKYLPQKSENLFVSSISNECGEGSNSGQATITVHQPEEIESLIKVYPNPAVDFSKLYIKLALLREPGEVKIIDAQGRELSNKILESDVTILDVRLYAAGVYYIKITAYDRQFVRKLVKK